VASSDKHRKICANVARLLRQEREKQAISLNALAKKAGLSRQIVSYIEQEKRNPTLETLLRLTDALGVSLDAIIKKARKL